MTKLLKSSKNALAFVLAFAVIAVSLFTGVLINADAAEGVDSVVYYGAATKTEPKTIDETDGTTILIKTAEELRWLAQDGGDATKGKTYKIADGIKTIVLQKKENVIAAGGLDALKALDANGVKEWFGDPVTATWTLKNGFTNSKNVNWNIWQNGSSQFQGTLDGNGATIYGMVSGDGISGLFEQANGATIKNLSIKSSIAYGYSGGILVGRALNNNTITIENCSIENCVSYSTRTAGTTPEYTTSGLVFGQVNIVNMNNCLISGCIAKHKNDTDADVGNTLAIGNVENVKDANNKSKNSIKNSIILGVTPYRPLKSISAWAGLSNDIFSNVYTDQPTKKVKGWYVNPSANNLEIEMTYSDNEIKNLEVTALTAVTKEMASGLDYTNTWIMTVNGPQLRALHGEFKATSDGANGHTLVCEDCGLKTSNTPEAHDWSNKDGVCKDCEYNCEHSESETVTVTDATCSAAKTVKNVCKVCGKTTKDTYSSGKALGHTLGKNLTKVERAATCTEDGIKLHYECSDCKKWFSDEKAEKEITEDQKSTYTIPADHNYEPVAAKDATCTDDGNIAHYKCTGCEKLFVEDTEGVKTETTLDKVTIEAKGHIALLDEDGKIVYEATDGKHYKVCSVCSTADKQILFDEEICTCDEYTSNGDGTHSGICTVCGLQTESKITHDCELEKVEKVDATTEKEGVNEHYKCSVCGGLYEDEEGKTPTTLEKLTIAKLEEKKEDNSSDNNNTTDNNNNNNNTTDNNNATTTTPNADKSNESPKTGDVATTAAAVVALLAAGYVLVRKFVKA